MKINKTVLRAYLQAQPEEIAAMTNAVAIGTEARKLWHVDKGPEARVLAVAHLDYVHAAQHAPQVLTIQPQGAEPREYVFHTALDDRLGAYIIGALLPSLGITTDILWTYDEEIGQTTAALYTAPKKQYNWIFSFDRRGDDVVGYSYESDQRWKRYVEEVGFKKGWGSFSCVQALRHLGVLGFNFGTGYHNEHQVMCFADLGETMQQVMRFMAFWKLRKDERLEFTPSAANNYYTSGYRGESAWSPAGEGQGNYGYPRGGQTQQQRFQGLETAGSPAKLTVVKPEPVVKPPAANAHLTPPSAADIEYAESMLLERDVPDDETLLQFVPEPCAMCHSEARRMFYSPDSDMWICGSCAKNFLDARDYVYGTCEDCRLLSLVSMATVNYGYPLCDECRSEYISSRGSRSRSVYSNTHGVSRRNGTHRSGAR